MCHLLAILIAANIIACSFAESARAALIVPLSQDRLTHVSTYVNGVTNSIFDHAPNYEEFSSYLSMQATPWINATSQQYSRILPATISGWCSAQTNCVDQVPGAMDHSLATSTVTIRFTITETVTYSLQGSFTSSGTSGIIERPYVRLNANDWSGPTIENVESSSGTLPFLRTGQLEPGIYMLRTFAEASSFGSWASTFSSQIAFNFTVTPVPSAGALPVFLLAAIGPRGRRRRQ